MLPTVGKGTTDVRSVSGDEMGTNGYKNRSPDLFPAMKIIHETVEKAEDRKYPFRLVYADSGYATVIVEIHEKYKKLSEIQLQAIYIIYREYADNPEELNNWVDAAMQKEGIADRIVQSYDEASDEEEAKQQWEMVQNCLQPNSWQQKVIAYFLNEL